MRVKIIYEDNGRNDIELYVKPNNSQGLFPVQPDTFVAQMLRGWYDSTQKQIKEIQPAVIQNADGSQVVIPGRIRHGGVFAP